MLTSAEENRAPRLRWSTWAFYAVLIAGGALRVVMVSTPFFLPTSDHAVVYLMARHAASGDFTRFYWGQSYGGTILPATAGVIMRVTGAHIEVLAAVSTAFFAVAAWFTRGIGIALVGPLAGDLAGIASWLPGLGMFTVSILDPGFYGPTMALSTAAIWLIARGQGRKPYWVWLLIGVLLGLAFWQSPIGLAFATPFTIWLVVRQPSVTRWLTGAAGAVLGAWPWLQLLITGDAGLLTPHGQGANWRNSVQLFTQVFPGAFQSDVTQFAPRWFRYAWCLALAAAVAAFVVWAVLHRRAGAVLIAASTATAAVAIVVGAGPLPLHQDSFRYTAFLWPSVAVVAGWLFSRLRFLPVVGVVLAALVTVVPVVRVASLSANAGQARWGNDAVAVVAYLRENNVVAAYADYALAYRIAAYQEERIVVASLVPDRYRPYDAAARAESPNVVIVNDGMDNDRLLKSRMQPNWTRVVVAGWAIYRIPGGVARLGPMPWAYS
jgi:hypothetical protein